MAGAVAALGALCGDAVARARGLAGDGAYPLGHADGRRAHHGHDALSGGVGAHPDLRPHGGAELRARGFRDGGRLRHDLGAASAWRLDRRLVADAQSSRAAGGARCRRCRERRARLCVRARHHPPSLRRTGTPDSDHHRRAHRDRAAGDRRVGTGSDTAAQAGEPARQHLPRRFLDRNLPPVCALRRPRRRRRDASGADAHPHRAGGARWRRGSRDGAGFGLPDPPCSSACSSPAPRSPEWAG